MDLLCYRNVIYCKNMHFLTKNILCMMEIKEVEATIKNREESRSNVQILRDNYESDIQNCCC
eukprot:c8158_g1_i1 orf=180-365(-)